jgi:APA family basic amino acid/polyamine antiporter
VVGWIEALGIYCAAIAAIAVVYGEYLARHLSRPAGEARALGLFLLVLLTGLNLLGVSAGRLVQNLTTSAKVLALAAVVVGAGLMGGGAAWGQAMPDAPTGLAAWGAMAVAFQAVIFSYYGYPDSAKIAEEVVDPARTLPRILLGGIALSTILYLLLNAAFFQVLPYEQIAASTLVPGDVVAAIFGAGAGAAVSALALIVVLGCLNGNLFATPRVVFGLSRDGLGPAALARVNAGGTPAPAMALVAAVALAMALTGTFERLLSLAIILILLTDGFMVLVLFRLRARRKETPFAVPFYPWVPLLFLIVYAVLFAGALWQQPGLSAAAVVALAATYVLSRALTR